MNEDDQQVRWQATAASVRGTSHEKTGQPCQDAHRWEILPGAILVAAVADGAGSASLGDMGAQVGADVPFFIFGHSAIARGIGEKLEPFHGLPSWSVLLVSPEWSLSTAWVYKHFTLRLTKGQEDSKVLPFPEDPSKIQSFLCNDLEQVAASKFPEIDSIKTALVDLGADGALMSGSGPAVFGLFRDPQQASLAFQKMRQERGGGTHLVNLLLP